MKNKGTNNISLQKMLILLEKVIKARKLDRKHHRDEMDKYFNYLCQGKDLLNVYERRNADVSDEEWKESLKEFKEFMGLTEKEKSS